MKELKHIHVNRKWFACVAGASTWIFSIMSLFCVDLRLSVWHSRRDVMLCYTSTYEVYRKDVCFV